MSNLNDNSYIKLPNNIYDNLDITNEELTVLTLMYRNYQQYKSIGVCSIQMIINYMRFDTQKNHQIVGIIKDAISGLIDKEYITCLYDLYYEEIIIEDIINKDTLFYVELVELPENNYFVVNDKDLNHIYKELESMKINKFNMTRYFIACRRVSNNDSNFGYLSQTKLKQLLNDSKTISKYNLILQDDLHLIRYNNSYLTEDKHYCTTFIGKYNDEDNFNHQLKIEVESRGLIHTDKIESNKRRSVKQEINNIIESTDKDNKIKELEAKLKQYEALQYKEKDDDQMDVEGLDWVNKEWNNDDIDFDTEDNDFIDLDELIKVG